MPKRRILGKSGHTAANIDLSGVNKKSILIGQKQFLWREWYKAWDKYLVVVNQKAIGQNFVIGTEPYKSWSYKQNLSVNLRYAHCRTIFFYPCLYPQLIQFQSHCRCKTIILVEILEQSIRMLKNKHSVILQWKYLYRIGPWWSSGNGRKLMFKWSWVWIPATDAEWTFIHVNFL